MIGEAGADITGQSSYTIDELVPIEFDLVVTVCGHLDESCPMFVGAYI